MPTNESSDARPQPLSGGAMVLRKVQFYFLLAVYMVLATARPEDAMPAGYNDLVVHFFAYVVLFNSCLLAMGAAGNRLTMYGGLLAYSFVIEVIQYTLPYRSFSLLDMLANAAGLYAGAVMGALLVSAGTKMNLIACPERPGSQAVFNDHCEPIGVPARPAQNQSGSQRS